MVKNPNIRTLFGLTDVRSFQDSSLFVTINDYAEYYLSPKELKRISSTIKQEKIFQKSSGCLGFEIEVENIRNSPTLPPGWSFKQDPSLRNNGVEIISVPLYCSIIPLSLFLLHNYLLKCSDNDPVFSWRTSVHVHCNVQDLTIPQFKLLLKLYLVIEPLFYHLIGNDRELSNFCVPLAGSSTAGVIKAFFTSPYLETSDLKFLIKLWAKYSGFGLFRLLDLGTVEFRHFYGTSDPMKLIQWSSLILKLYEAASTWNQEKTDSKIKMLNTTSEYEQFVKYLFGDILPFHPAYALLIEKGTRYCKYCMTPELSKHEFAVTQVNQKYFPVPKGS